jgi:hypothetical protein
VIITGSWFTDASSINLYRLGRASVAVSVVIIYSFLRICTLKRTQ